MACFLVSSHVSKVSFANLSVQRKILNGNVRKLQNLFSSFAPGSKVSNPVGVCVRRPWNKIIYQNYFSKLKFVSYSQSSRSDGISTENERRAKGIVKESEGPFRSLGIKQVAEKVGGVRLRQHVNPLRRELQVISPPPVWEEVFEDATQPLHVDVGCGHGRFCLLKATREPEVNFLGLDIRSKLTERGNKWSDEIGVAPNVHFLFTNATVSLLSILQTYPGQVFCITIQFPDPHFKSRHHKRRVVQPQLVDAAAAVLQVGGQVFLQSDVKEVAEAMRDAFERNADGRFCVCPQLHTFDPDFKPELPEKGKKDQFVSEWAAWGWLESNPMSVPTEREVLVRNEGKPVYRVMLRKCLKDF